MTHRSRAAERKAKEAASNAAATLPNPDNRTAAAPIPIPDEAETVPVIPLPDIEKPLDSELDPRFPIPTTAQEFRQRLEMVGDEDPECFDFLREILDRHYNPTTMHTQALVEDLARARWLVLRRERILNAIEAETHQTQPDATKWSEDQFKRISLADGHLAQAERAYRNALENAYPLVRERIESYQWELTFDLHVREFEFEKKKLELAMLQAQADVRTRKAGAH
jgi:hypothetical protein